MEIFCPAMNRIENCICNKAVWKWEFLLWRLSGLQILANYAATKSLMQKSRLPRETCVCEDTPTNAINKQTNAILILAWQSHYRTIKLATMILLCSLFWEHCSVVSTIPHSELTTEAWWDHLGGAIAKAQYLGRVWEGVSEKFSVTVALALLWTEWTPEVASSRNHFMILYRFVTTRDYLLQSRNTYFHFRTGALQLLIWPFLLCVWQLIPGCPWNRFLGDQSSVHLMFAEMTSSLLSKCESQQGFFLQTFCIHSLPSALI